MAEAENGRTVCVARINPEVDNDHNTEIADTRLIASAPDLLAALRATYDAMGARSPSDRLAAGNMARAAIAKAIGQ